jgi:hypothetical protein
MWSFLKSHPVASVLGALWAIMTVVGVVLDGREITALGIPGYWWAAIGAALFIFVVVNVIYRQHQAIEGMSNAPAPIQKPGPTPRQMAPEANKQIEAEIESLLKRNEEFDAKIIECEENSNKIEFYSSSEMLKNSAEKLREDKRRNEARIDALTKSLRGSVN